MHRTALELLACPHCRSALGLRAEAEIDPVTEGALLCRGCGREFPIDEGIPRFVQADELEGSNRRFARFYDRIGAAYGPAVKLGFLFMGGERSARMEVLRHIEAPAGRALEVSIGPGVNLPLLESIEGLGEIHGLDISAVQLLRCRAFALERDLPVDLTLGTAEALPYRDEVFDTVFHIGGINFFSDRQQAIREMIRVARPGTRIVIADETERLASLFDRLPRRSRSARRAPADAPQDWVPPSMEDIQLRGIWRAHGHDHGYCLTFRKPAGSRTTSSGNAMP